MPRVICGGEDGVMGVYGGEPAPDPHRTAAHRLIRVDAIYRYPGQRAIVQDAMCERLPLPYGAVVRMRIIGEDERKGAQDEAEYNRMVEAALLRLLAAPETAEDSEVYGILTERIGRHMTAVSGSYARR